MLNTISRRDGGRRMYCGPAALCAISGKHYEDVRAVINRYRDRPENRGVLCMGNDEICHTLEELGFRHTLMTFPDKEYPTGKPTLAKFLKDRPEELRDKILLINVTGHYVTVKGDMLIDNHTVSPVHIAIAPYKKARVKRYWIIE